MRATPCGFEREGTSSTTSPSRWIVSPGRTGFSQRRSSTPAPNSGCGPNGRKAAQDCLLRGLLVEVKRLRIVFPGEAKDVVFRHGYRAALESHADLQIVEPLNHAA